MVFRSSKWAKNSKPSSLGWRKVIATVKAVTWEIYMNKVKKELK